MHRPAALVFAILVAAAGVGAAAAPVHGHPTPAARFWEEALPGTPMPEAIADLVQKGTDRSSLVERYSAATSISPNACLGYHYSITCDPGTAATGIFFHQAALRVGSTMTVSFPPSAAAAILPLGVADKIAFATSSGNHRQQQLADILATLKIAPDSAEAAQVSSTVRGCQEPPLAGEQKACATSLEGVVRAAMRMLGTRRVQAAASALPRAGLPRQEYTVQAVSQLNGSRFVACHSEPYPYAVYQCHETGQRSMAYVMSIRGPGEGGAAIAMVALCHLDTTSWNPGHPAFKILRTQPGGLPVCHFLPYADLLFGKKVATA